MMKIVSSFTPPHDFLSSVEHNIPYNLLGECVQVTVLSECSGTKMYIFYNQYNRWLVEKDVSSMRC